MNRTFFRLVPFVLSIALLTACGGPPDATPTAAPASASAIPPTAASPTAQPTPTLALPPDTVDTRQVIYNDAEGNLYRLDLDSREVETIDSGVVGEFAFFLSPDGSKIIYHFTRPEFEAGTWHWRTALLDLENGRQIQLADPGNRVTWDPHGEYFITYLHRDDYSGDALVSGRDASTLAPLDRLYFPWDAEISPQGEIVYSDILEDVDVIKALEIRFDAQGRFEGLAENPRLTLRPYEPDNTRAIVTISISPDGERVAFILASHASNATPLADHADIYVMDLDGGGLVNLTDGTFIEADRALREELFWSPNGEQIAFVSYPNVANPLEYRVHVANTGGSGLVEITGGEFPSGWSPSWSPDGSKLLFVTFDSQFVDFGQIVIANPDGSGRQILPGVERVFLAAYRPALSLHASTVNCAARFTRLETGMQAVVAEGEPNRVRSEPARGDNQIASINAGTVVRVVDGPVCTEDLVFWQVESDLIPGGSGWTAEGDWSAYWLEPYRP